MRKPSSKFLMSLGGFAIGIVNGLFGAGGGMLAVPFLKLSGCDQKGSHANSVALILPLCIVSSVLYWAGGKIDCMNVLYFIPSGLIGAFVGTKLLRRIPDKWLKRIFSLFMLWAGMRLLLK